MAPILVRARLDQGDLPHRVEARVTWLPSRITRTYAGSGAQGMCLVPWYADSSRAVIAVFAEGAQGEVHVRAGQTQFGRAFDVRLAAAPIDQGDVLPA